MEMKKYTEKLHLLIDKYKFPIIILAIGLLLMLIPSWQTDRQIQEQTVASTKDVLAADEKLEQVLGKISGAGKVSVMLMESAGEEIIYQINYDESTDSKRVDTVLVTDENRKENGLIKQINPAIYSGAIIVCEGGDDPAIRLAIVEAVSAITGLGADRISVLKMK